MVGFNAKYSNLVTNLHWINISIWYRKVHITVSKLQTHQKSANNNSTMWPLSMVNHTFRCCVYINMYKFYQITTYRTTIGAVLLITCSAILPRWILKNFTTKCNLTQPFNNGNINHHTAIWNNCNSAISTSNQAQHPKSSKQTHFCYPHQPKYPWF